jgi:hypothetical protein
MRQCLAILLCACAIFLLATPSHARTRHHPHQISHHSSHGVARVRVTLHKSRRGHQKRLARSHYVRQLAGHQVRSKAGQAVNHPRGCPSTSFCGCGVALHVFGHHVRSLWLAANWLSFPPAKPAPGMVAVRRGHVFAILENRGGGSVLAYDPNSGRHRTRIHVRSLAGFKIVNPRAGSRYAEAVL